MRVGSLVGFGWFVLYKEERVAGLSWLNNLVCAFGLLSLMAKAVSVRLRFMAAVAIATLSAMCWSRRLALRRGPISRSPESLNRRVSISRGAPKTGRGGPGGDSRAKAALVCAMSAGPAVGAGRLPEVLYQGEGEARARRYHAARRRRAAPHAD